MKKLLFLLLTLILFGCEMYTEESNPQLNLNGRWKIIQIIPNWDKEVILINKDSIIQAPYSVDSIDIDGNMMLKNGIPGSPCFSYKLGYVWEFDYCNLILQNNMGKILYNYRYGSHGSYVYNPNDFDLYDKVTDGEIPGIWHITPLDATFGSMPASDISITVPTIYFNLESSGRTFDRFVLQGITLILTRY